MESSISDFKLITSKQKNIFKRQLQPLLLLTSVTVVDGLLLIGWVLAQWLMNNLVSGLVNQGVDPFITLVGQLLFAIATLLPIMLHIFRNLYTMLLRARSQIKQANESEYNRNIMLEYRTAELQGILDWALSNNVLVKDIHSSQIEQIQKQALEMVKRRHRKRILWRLRHCFDTKPAAITYFISSLLDVLGKWFFFCHSFSFCPHVVVFSAQTETTVEIREDRRVEQIGKKVA